MVGGDERINPVCVFLIERVVGTRVRDDRVIVHESRSGPDFVFLFFFLYAMETG